MVIFATPCKLYAEEESSESPSAVEGSEESAVVDSDSEVTKEEPSTDLNLTGSRPWRAPDFSNQKSALGWSEDAFATPKGLEKNVAFWLDVYTRLTTDQGVLHDSENIDLIFATFDFSHIAARADLDAFQKERQRRRLVKEGKERVKEKLRRLSKLKDTSELSSDDKRIWDFFQTRGGPKEMLAAASEKRLRFQLGQRDRIIQGIFYSGRYLEDFERIFQEEGLPKELTRLVFVESSFNVLARSRVGASGLWQIMPYTARRKLMMNLAIDKRNHPLEATRMAAQYLRGNYQMLQSWPLAITGYNHGPAGVRRLTELHRSRELVDLAAEVKDAKGRSKRRLGFASRNFYASFLAILEAERRAPFYFGTVLWSNPLNAVDYELPAPIQWRDLLSWFEGKDALAQIYNPHVTSAARKSGLPIPKGARVSVPAGKLQLVKAEVEKVRAEVKQGKRKMETVKKGLRHRVKRGDTLIRIAREYGVSVRELRRNNQLSPDAALRVGQELLIGD